MTQHNTTEILAPAGSYESLMAGIKAGSNAVYFGVEQLNMRAKSSNNFTIEDITKVATIGSEHNVKTYLTINTILYNHDLSLMQNILNAAKDSGITAVIASDHAVLNYAKKIHIPIHISTQCNISNIETVEFYAGFADVIVLARELSLMQVAEITKEIKRRNIVGVSGALMRVEVFCHGALCMAVSGKCYLSLHSNFASANRGACVQNCRRSYVVTDKEEGNELEIDNEYIMSAKDLCTIGFLDKIIAAGVSVLKIEGRGRAPEYVYTTVQCYREAVESIAQGSYTPEKIKQWETRLATVYNRGFWDGYYLGKTMGEWSEAYGSKATKRKIYIAKGLKYFDKQQVAEFKMEVGQTLQEGDELIITGPTTGVVEMKATSIKVENVATTKVVKGESFTMPIVEKIRASDKMYKIVSV